MVMMITSGDEDDHGDGEHDNDNDVHCVDFLVVLIGRCVSFVKVAVVVRHWPCRFFGWSQI